MNKYKCNFELEEDLSEDDYSHIVTTNIWQMVEASSHREAAIIFNDTHGCTPNDVSEEENGECMGFDDCQECGKMIDDDETNHCKAEQGHYLILCDSCKEKREKK